MRDFSPAVIESRAPLYTWLRNFAHNRFRVETINNIVRAAAAMRLAIVFITSRICIFNGSTSHIRCRHYGKSYYGILVPSSRHGGESS
jgi:hypothetical protein